MSERVHMWTVDRPSAVSGSPDGPIAVQPGDVVVVYVAKSWSEAAERLKGDSGKPR